MQTAPDGAKARSGLPEQAGPGFTVAPFPRSRQLVQDAWWMSRRRHLVHGLLEVDVTLARSILRRHRERTGEQVSFTAFTMVCVGAAVAADRRVQAYRDWRGRLIIFDDVDVLLAMEAGSEEAGVPHMLLARAVNRRTVLDVHAEIRAAQANPVDQASKALQRFAAVPAAFRHLIYRIAERMPHWRRRIAGTVGLTSVGMFGSSGGWALGAPGHSLAFLIGGISVKPGLVDGQLAPREVLNVTISFDHDLVDGAPAARFARRFTELMESGFGLDGLGSPAAKET